MRGLQCHLGTLYGDAVSSERQNATQVLFATKYKCARLGGRAHQRHAAAPPSHMTDSHQEGGVKSVRGFARRRPTRTLAATARDSAAPLSLPVTSERWSERIRPGLASYADDPANAWRHVAPLVGRAEVLLAAARSRWR